MSVNPASLANLKPYPPGVSGNPGGKPVGARNRINAKFLDALEKDFNEGGIKAIKQCREDDPAAYVRALMALQPKEVEISQSPFSELSDEQLESIFTACRALLAAENGSRGEGGTQGSESPQDVHALREAG